MGKKKAKDPKQEDDADGEAADAEQPAEPADSGAVESNSIDTAVSAVSAVRTCLALSCRAPTYHHATVAQGLCATRRR